MLDNISEWFAGQYWSLIDGIITLATLIFVALNFYKGRKNDEKIEIYFDINGEKEKLTTFILRKHITRAEIAGILRSKKKTEVSEFNIEYLSSVNYLEDIFKIQKGKKDSLIIHITPEEIKDFYDNL
jgi:hypothetical protein